MERLSTRLPADTLAELEARADRNGVSPAAAARECIESALADERGPSADERIQHVREEYEADIADLETEIERLNRERRQLLEQREEHTDLVRAVEKERSLDERKARANWLTRQKWRLLGVPDDGE